MRRKTPLSKARKRGLPTAAVALAASVLLHALAWRAGVAGVSGLPAPRSAVVQVTVLVPPPSEPPAAGASSGGTPAAPPDDPTPAATVAPADTTPPAAVPSAAAPRNSSAPAGFSPAGKPSAGPQRPARAPVESRRKPTLPREPAASSGAQAAAGAAAGAVTDAAAQAGMAARTGSADTGDPTTNEAAGAPSAAGTGDSTSALLGGASAEATSAGGSSGNAPAVLPDAAAASRPDAAAANQSDSAAGAGLPQSQAVVEPPPQRMDMQFDAFVESAAGDARIGTARFALQTGEGRYAMGLQARGPLSRFAYASDGTIEPGGFRPERFSETRDVAFRAPVARSVWFAVRPDARLGADAPELPDGAALAVPPGTQDRLSVLLQLWLLVRSQPERLAVGSEIAVMLASTRRVDRAVFRAGPVEPFLAGGRERAAVRLTRLPAAGKAVGIEVWLAAEPPHLPLGLRYVERDRALRFAVSEAS